MLQRTPQLPIIVKEKRKRRRKYNRDKLHILYHCIKDINNTEEEPPHKKNKNKRSEANGCLHLGKNNSI